MLENDVVVQVLLQVLGTLVASVAIVDREDLDLGPVVLRDLLLLVGWLDHVQDDGNSVLVGLPHETHVGVGCEGLHHSKLLVGCLGVLEVGQH